MTDVYKDPSAPMSARVDDLLGRMNIDEKLAQLGCLWVTSLVSGDRLDVDRAARLMRHGMGQITRIGASTGLRPEGSAALMNEIQRVAVESTRLGIPVMVHEESTGGFCSRDATVFPQALGLASTWDPSLVGEIADVIRRQMVAVGARQSLAPVLDIARDPRWGRTEETYGEDPVLAGTMGVAYVRGLQGADLRNGVAATGKHFLGYAMSEGGRNHGPVQLGPRELREVYAEPFAAVIRDGGLASIMNSYSSIDGLPCAASAAVLTGLLRDELGFEGVVVADYFSLGLLIRHHRTAGDKAEVAVQALTAGLDIELPATDCYGEPLKAAIEDGRVSIDVVNQAVRRALVCKMSLGLFENPYVDAGAAAAVFDTVADRTLARRAVAASIVMLTNDGVLPVDPAVGRVAVIGPGADDVRLLQGDYHYPAHVEIVYEGGLNMGDDQAPPTSDGIEFLPVSGGAFAPGPFFTPHVTPLAAIREAVSAATEVLYARGCDVSGDDESGLADAVQAAGAADVAIVVVAGRSGLRPACTVGEARDATDLYLTGLQERLVAEVAGTGTPTVVVVMSGRVHTLDRVCASAAATLVAWPPGEEGGHGIADLVFGLANPAGRLPVTIPRSVGQIPIFAGHRNGGHGSMFYGQYTDSPSEPLFCFGHGLSYTSFGYGDVDARASTTTEHVVVSVDVTNTGDRAGDEVVQLYFTDKVASVVRPSSQLVGFARISLAPGERVRVAFDVHPSRLAFYDQQMRYVVEPGRFRVAVGSSSADIRASCDIDLEGRPAEFEQRRVVATAVTATRIN